jgi:hypothetical protein
MVKEKKEDLIKSVGELKHENTSLKNSIGSYKSANTKYRAEIGDLLRYKKALREFNNKPWYKRIFAKKIVVE